MSNYDIGEKVGELSHTLGRSPSKENNVTAIIKLDGQNVEHGRGYFFKCLVLGSGDKALVDDGFIGEVHDSQKSVTIPLDFIRDNELKPGHSLKVAIYEVSENESQEPEQTQLADDDRKWEYITTFTVISDSGSSDGCDSRFVDSTLHDRMNGKTDAKLVNNRNGKSIVTQLKPLTGNDVSFHLEDRKALNTKPNDSVNVYLPRLNDDASGAMTQIRKIDEMYEMIDEMYDAYLEAKDD